MKKRVFQNMVNAVFCVSIYTEDWSEGDCELMDQFGEPEINVGGDVEYVFDNEHKTKKFGDEFVRVIHGFPYKRGFDSRDYSSYDEAVAVGKAWKDIVLDRIDSAVVALRENAAPLPTEEISEI